NKSLEMSEFVSGAVSSLFYLAYCITIVLSTVITTREGPRRMIILAGLSAFAGLLLMSVTPNAWVLALGVLFAGGSTGLVSPPYGAAISLWIRADKQGKANTWINSGTSFGIVLSGVGAILLTPNWRLSYLIYAILTFLILIWNFRAIPKDGKRSSVMIEKGKLSIRGVKGATPLILASFILGVSTAAFWTFSRSFIEVAGNYSDWQLSGFWIIIGLFGVLGGFSGSLILAVTSENWFMSYLSAGIFGCFYIFTTGVLLVWGIRVFITNASLGIGIPFLLLAVGQVIGSMLAGWFIGTWGYAASFIIYGLVGMVAPFIGPKRSKKESDFDMHMKQGNY